MTVLSIFIRLLTIGISLFGFVLGGIGSYFDYKEATVTPVIFGLSIMSWAFLLFAIGMFVIVIQLLTKIRSLEGRKPKIKVTPRVEGRYAYLDVENTGDIEGEFTVELFNLNGMENGNFRPRYTVRWQDNEQDVSSRIVNKDGIAVIELFDAHSVRISKNRTDDESKSETVQMVNLFGSHRTFDGEMIVNGEITFSLKITSVPAMNKPFDANYQLVVGENEWLSLKEIP